MRVRAPRVFILIGALAREGGNAVVRNASRSTLTAVGIAIGIAAVVWVVALGRAGAALAEAQLQKLGDNLVWVEAGSRNVNGARTGNLATTTLTVDDAHAIALEIPSIRSVSPQVDGSILALHGERNWLTRYRGVAPEYLDIKRWEIAAGRVFTHEDVAQVTNVVLLGETVRAQLFGEAPAVGETIRIGVQLFEVVGILGAKGQSAEGRDQDDTVFVPYATAMTKLRGKGLTWVDDIVCSATAPETVDVATRDVMALMRERHALAPGIDDDFNIRRPEELIRAQLEANATFERLLLATASVALLVGGIGTMNVMLASVAERRREIGLRMAVGAKAWAVHLQFLAEAVVLCLFGGAVGVAASLVGSFALERALGWSLSLSPGSLAVAAGVSVAVGIVFGFLPAWRAARLDPIEALRSE